MAETSEYPVIQNLLPKNEIIEDTQNSGTANLNVNEVQNIDRVKSYNKTSVTRCKHPFNKHDRHLIFMLVGLVLLSLGFIFLKNSKRIIAPIK